MTTPDFRGLFCAFSAHEVRFLGGAYAVTLHTPPRFTKGLDVWVDPDPENAQRTWKALAGLGAPPAEVAVEDIARPELVLQIGVPPNRIDVLTSLTALDLADAWSGACPASTGQRRSRCSRGETCS